jgi:DNA repair exonuclease SbcCD ATPase subunit
MEIRFKTLTLTNFMSYGKVKTVIDLQRTGTTLILGEDLDNTTEGQSSNGVGKTTVMNALTYALYDRPISDIKIDELINNVNKTHMEVIVEFVKGGIPYRVERRRKSGKSGRDNTVHLFIDGEDKTRGGPHIMDKVILDIIGMPYDMFVRIVVISATHSPFLDMPVNSHYQANQTDFIERLFNLTVLSEQAVMLKDLIKNTEDSMNINKMRIEQLEKEHMRFVEQIKSAKMRVENWDSSNSKTILTYERQLTEAEGINVDEEQKLHHEIDELERKSREILQEKKQTKSMVEKYKKMIDESTHELKHLTDQRCPYCLQQYADADSKIDSCKERIGTSNTQHEKLMKELGFIEEDEHDLQQLLKVLKKRRQVNDVDQLLEIHSHKQTIHQKVQDLKNAENPFLEPLKELEDYPLDAIDYSDLNKLKKTQDHQQFLLKLLTKKDSFVRKALLNKNLPFLNTRLHHNLTQLGLTHKVEFTHEMTANISLFGRPLSFGNLSNGQRARVNLALALAFRDVLQKLHTPINICLLDEVLDVGLDTVGVQSAGRMLKKKARDENLNIFIISHRDEIGNIFDRTMMVQMQKGFSSIKDVTEQI